MSSQSPNDYNRPPRGGFNPEDRAPAEARAAPAGPTGPRRSSKGWGWVAAVVALVLLVTLVLCCGIGWFLFQAGMDQLATQVQMQVEDHPVIEEHIGEIQSLEMSPQQTGELGERGRVVLTVEGTKGDGRIIGRQEFGEQQLTDLVLETPDGEQYPLEQ